MTDKMIENKIFEAKMASAFSVDGTAYLMSNGKELTVAWNKKERWYKENYVRGFWVVKIFENGHEVEI